MSLLGLDVGSSGVKAVVFRASGEALAASSRSYGMLFPAPGYVELDPHVMRSSIEDVIREVNAKVRGDPVRAVSVCSFGEGFTAIDRRGAPITNFMCPVDARATSEYQDIVAEFGEYDLYARTGVRPFPIWSVAKMLWLRRRRPEVYDATHRLLFGEDFVYWLLGVPETALSYSMASRTMCFDIYSRSWANDMLGALGLDAGKLSRPLPSGSVIASIDRRTADRLGFVGEVAVVVGGHDQACAALGVGTIDPGAASNGMGSVECIAPVFLEPIVNRTMFDGGYCCEPHAVADRFLSNGIIITASSVLRWFGETFRGRWCEGPPGSEIRFEAIFDRLDDRPSDLAFLPYFATSSNHYVSDRPLGAVVGLSLATRPEDVAKAIVEGLVFELKMHLDQLRECGARIDELRASGGSSRSRYWLQLKANVLSIPVARLRIDEAGCLAGAILGGVATNLFDGVREAVEALVAVREVILPQPTFVREPYLRKERVYAGMFKTLSALMAAEGISETSLRGSLP